MAGTNLAERWVLRRLIPKDKLKDLLDVDGDGDVDYSDLYALADKVKDIVLSAQHFVEDFAKLSGEERRKKVGDIVQGLFPKANRVLINFLIELAVLAYGLRGLLPIFRGVKA